MRIISIRLGPVTRILSVVYAILGFVIFCHFEFSDAPYLTLPFGIVAPLVYLNINLNLPRSDTLAYIFFSGLAEILAYAVTGWITGAAAVLCFNVVAKRMGGVDAKYFTTIDEAKDVRPED